MCCGIKVYFNLINKLFSPFLHKKKYKKETVVTDTIIRNGQFRRHKRLYINLLRLCLKIHRLELNFLSLCKRAKKLIKIITFISYFYFTPTYYYQQNVTLSANSNSFWQLKERKTYVFLVVKGVRRSYRQQVG